MSELPKHFDPADIEARWYGHWEQQGLFRPERKDATPFTIVNPPPNVTGKLHIGHALDNTLQDILVRHARMQGKDALWVVGTDHAGIATQMVVERQLNEKQDKRTNYTREEFVSKVWDWKEKSGGEITQQLRRLGCSMDWSNEQFTMDPNFERAVLKVFVDLYNDGLIYRDKRLVNWDPGLKTAISDLEVENTDVNGHFWHFSYPLEDGSGAISVATTRPETMLADMAVAVHPSDERYADMVGKNVKLPITGRLVPIITDEHADPELGSGAVKITPGHDFNDFDVGKRAGFKPAEMLNMLDADANVVQVSDGLIPEEYLGLHRFHRDGTDGARELVIAQMKEQGFLIPQVSKNKEGEEEEQDSEPRTIVTPYGDRSNVVIEPWLTDQWYVDAETLAQPAMEAVRSGAIEIVPKSWEKTFFNWMENIQPWCVSRQLWWGHRIPAWHCFNHITLSTEIFVAEKKEEFEILALAKDESINEFIYFNSRRAALEYAPDDGIPANTCLVYRDEDVLDTWFSSGLWPFATIGWPGDAIDKSSPLMGEDLGGGDPSASDDASGEITPPQTPPHQGEGLKAKPGSDLARHYPNDVLISGFDILFFWDARMMMQGIQFMDDVPFRKLYLHGLVRAADGQKMSKSKGNTVDPLGLIDEYGADALRFFMAAMESQGRDIKMDETRVEGYRNFATKLWNASRFCQSNGIGASETVAAPEATLPVNRWIISEVVETLDKLNRALDDLRFDGAADTIYHFVWDKFCDWYLELIKPQMDGKGADECRTVAGWVLDQILVMLHPFMPFITEELWHAMGDRGGHDIIVAKWPDPGVEVDVRAQDEISRLIEIVGAVRAQRNETNIPPGAKLPTTILVDEANEVDLLNKHKSVLTRLARIESALVEREKEEEFTFGSTTMSDKFEVSGRFDTTSFTAVQFPIGPLTLVSAVDGFVDLKAETERILKNLEAAEKEMASLDKRLGNPQFVEKAKPEAVEKAKADHAEKAAEAKRLKAALERLG